MFEWCQKRYERRVWEKAYKIKATIRVLEFRWYLWRKAADQNDPEEVEASRFFMKVMIKELLTLVGFKKADILLERIYEGSKKCE